MTERNLAIHRLCGRLLISLAVLLITIVFVLIATRWGVGFFAATPFLALVVGAIGGFVSLQRKLKHLSADDLDLLSRSWFYTIQAPFVGGILALLLYILFLSDLVQGTLFPVFVADTDNPKAGSENFEVIFATHGDAKDYAKLVFWCFLAGFSENFVTDMIGQVQQAAATPRKPE